MHIHFYFTNGIDIGVTFQEQGGRDNCPQVELAKKLYYL